MADGNGKIGIRKNARLFWSENDLRHVELLMKPLFHNYTTPVSTFSGWSVPIYSRTRGEMWEKTLVSGWLQSPKSWFPHTPTTWASASN